MLPSDVQPPPHSSPSTMSARFIRRETAAAEVVALARHQSRGARRRHRRRYRQSGAGKSTLIRLVNGLERPSRWPRRRRWHRRHGARRARPAPGPPFDRHDLPAFQPAVVPHRVRECRLAARNRRLSTRLRSAGASSRCWRWSGSPTSATAIRPNCPAGRSSASALPAHWRPSRRCCCRTRRPPRSIRKPPTRFCRCSRPSTPNSS